MKKGQYIVIEGGDGTGKTTLIEQLKQYYQSNNQPFIEIHEPGGNPIADQIRKILKDKNLERHSVTNLLLFTASRAEVWLEKMKPALNQGKIVLSSRNWFSTWVYQGFAENLGVEKVEKFTETALEKEYLWPDKVIILTLDNQTRKQRFQSRDNNYKNDHFETQGDDYQDKISQGYLELAKKFDFPTVDASQTPDQVFEQVLEIINQ